MLVATTIVLAVIAVHLVRRHFDGPRYEGRSLRFWISIYGAKGYQHQTTPEQDAAALAIRAIGTNALPYLLKWIDHQPGKLNLYLQAKIKMLPAWLFRRPLNWFLKSPDERRSHAIIAFEALGPMAAPAVPELNRLACRTNGPGPNRRVLRALGCIGAPAMPAVLDFVTNSPFSMATSAFVPFDRLGTNALPLITFFANQLGSSNLNSAILSANYLGIMRIAPEQTVPALISSLADPRPITKMSAALALRQFGPDAQSALPALSNLVHDSDSQVRDGARQAIAAIRSGSGQ